MSEKTAEEKLRQELEGNTSGTKDSVQPKSQSKPKPSRTRPKSGASRSVKSESIGERLDSFMDDFERRIEQSINAVKSPSESHVKPRREKISAEHKPETSRRVHTAVKANPEPLEELIPLKHESSQEIDATQEDSPVSQPESMPEISQLESSHEVDAVQGDSPVSQPESTPEISQIESSHDIDTAQEDFPVQPESTPEISQPESSHDIDALQEDLPVSQPESTPEISQPESSHDIDTLQEDLPVSQPEATQEDFPVQPESVPEEIIPDVMPLDEELPDIPVIEAAFDEVPEKTQTPYGDLPDIPVISADDEDDDTEEIFSDGLEDITPPADDEPRKESQIEFQEAELTEAPEIEDDFADIDADSDSDDFTDEPLDEEPETPDAEEDAPPYDIESDEAGIFADDSDDDIADDTHGDFTPSADVVLNVDDEIPQISQQEQITNDPEAESVPVTVTMPESTKTAEDKLMADIAEAMTGNPLSLESNEAPAYNIPENFFTESANNGDSPQSAEDKLKANIVQALSESPINAAHEQARQSLEEDINPFDELSITEPEIESHEEDFLPQESFDTEESLTQESLDAEESLTEESHDNEESFAEESINDEDFLPKKSLDDEESLPQESIDDEDFTPQETNVNDDLMPDSDSLTENEDDSESLNDPFTIPDFPDDEEESETSANLESSEDETKFFTEAFKGDDDIEESSEPEPDLDLLPKIEPETESAQDIFTEPESQPEPEILRKPEINTEEESESPVDDNDMPFPVEEPKKEPLTEQEALIAMLNQEFEPESNNFTAQEEAQPENNMPENSLLNDDAPENNDDWDISSLGDELGQAATLADESEDFSASPETVTEMITQPEAGIIHNPEDDHKEKTMNIREKLASRKNGNSESAAGKSSKSGLLLTVLTALLAVIGGLIVWQLMQVSDKITSLAMNAPGYESSARAETPSYDYAIDFILDPNLSDRMSQRGRAGWQVVGSRRTQDSTTGQYGYEFIFMRRTPGR